MTAATSGLCNETILTPTEGMSVSDFGWFGMGVGANCCAILGNIYNAASLSQSRPAFSSIASTILKTQLKSKQVRIHSYKVMQ
jgi:hypothetical protein